MLKQIDKHMLQLYEGEYQEATNSAIKAPLNSIAHTKKGVLQYCDLTARKMKVYS